MNVETNTSASLTKLSSTCLQLAPEAAAAWPPVSFARVSFARAEGCCDPDPDPDPDPVLLACAQVSLAAPLAGQPPALWFAQAEGCCDPDPDPDPDPVMLHALGR